MQFFSYVFFLSLITFNVNATDVAKQESLVLQSIDTQSNPNQSLVNLRFNETIEKKDFQVEDHGSFFQISFVNTLLASPGKFVEGNSPYILKVGGFQGSESLAIIRFFLSEKTELIKQAMNISAVGNRVVLSVDHIKLKDILSSGNLQGPLKKLKKIKTTVKKTNAPDFFEMDDYIVKISIVSLFLFSLLILLTLAKKYQRRKFKNSKVHEGFPFKEIDRLVLSPRLKISVVQIGEERLVLSISQDKVEFLTKLTAQESLEKKLIPHKIGKDSRELDAEAKSLALKMLSKSQVKKEEPSFLSKLRESTSTENVREKKQKNLEESKPSQNKELVKNKRINYKIDDEGVHDTSMSSEKKEMDSKASKAMSDLTKMIRDKINSLPKV